MFKKKIFIHAYLFSNLGDDLFVRELCLRYPKVQFLVVATAVYKKTFEGIHNLKILSCDSYKAKKIDEKYKKEGIDQGYKFYLASKADAVVHIGGSAFVQHKEDYCPFYEFDANLVRFSKRLYQIGANFGPYKDNAYYQSYHELFGNYQSISFRDKASYELFQDIEQASYAPDVLFGMKVNKQKKKKQEAVLSVIDMENRLGMYPLAQYEDAYLRWNLLAIRWLLERGYKVKLLSFCSCEYDPVMINKIMTELTKEEQDKVSTHFYEQNIEEMLTLFEEAKICIGTRFHSVVLGLVCRCKVLPVIYSVKTNELLKDLHIEEKVELSDLHKETMQSFATRMQNLKEVDHLAQIEEKAKEQFKGLDQYLYKKGA